MLSVLVSPSVTTRKRALRPIAVVTVMHASQRPATLGIPLQSLASRSPSSLCIGAAYFVPGAQALGAALAGQRDRTAATAAGRPTRRLAPPRRGAPALRSRWPALPPARSPY